MALPTALPPARVPFGNGHGTGWLSAPSGRLEGLLTHTYAERAPNDPAVDLASESFAGVAIDDEAGVWLNERDAESIQFEAGTGVLRVSHRVGPLTVDCFWFAPWTLARPSVAMIARVTNEDPLNGHALTIAAMLRYALGEGAPEASGEGERITLVGQSVFQEAGLKSRHRMVYRALPTANQVGLSPSDPFADFASLGKMTGGIGGGDVLDPISGDHLEAAFARGPVQLAPGAQTWLAVVAAHGDASEETRIGPAIDAWVAGRSPGAILEDELAAWRVWTSRDALPARVEAQGNVLIRTDELAVWSQALVTLRMSQVREANADLVRPAGQIVAALLPGPRQRTYPRDLAYGTAALVRAGYPDEAWDALSFVLSGHAGRLSATIGANYAVSVSRYFGDGTEDTRSQSHPTVPTVGFDGFGLYLWALGAWADEQPSLARLQPHWLTIRDRIAEALMTVVDPATGLLRADAGIWEHTGQERQHTMTTIAAVAGLCAASRIAARLGEPHTASRFGEQAASLRAAMLERLIDPATGALVGNLEELAAGTARDASVVEAINWGLIPADSGLARATLDGVGLLALGPGLGLARSDDPEDADRESVLADLRAAAALSATGRQFEADALVSRVVTQSRKRAAGFVPELLDPWGGPAGGLPMAGMGGAALGLARLDGEEIMNDEGCLPWVPAVEPVPDEEPDAAELPDEAEVDAASGPGSPVLGPPRAAPKGGCGGAPGGPWPLMLLLASLVAAMPSRTRRQRR
ncbi:MAG: hypothetical protein R3F39_23935 [Myxococcota bacterium]